jgi:hypothetical protein
MMRSLVAAAVLLMPETFSTTVVHPVRMASRVANVSSMLCRDASKGLSASGLPYKMARQCN